MENKVKKVIANVLDIDFNILKNDASPGQIEQWDSLKQMNIIIALEDEFDIEFTDEEISELNSIELISQIIKNKL